MYHFAMFNVLSAFKVFKQEDNNNLITTSIKFPNSRRLHESFLLILQYKSQCVPNDPTLSIVKSTLNRLHCDDDGLHQRILSMPIFTVAHSPEIRASTWRSHLSRA